MLKVGPIEWQSLDDFRRTTEVNLWGTIAVTKTFLPLVKQGKGRIVNMGSTLCKYNCVIYSVFAQIKKEFVVAIRGYESFTAFLLFIEQ